MANKVVVTGVGLISSIGNDQDSVVKAFEKHVASLDLKDDQKSIVQKIVDERKSESAQDAITEGLMAAYPDYSKAIEATDNDDVTQAVSKLKALVEGASIASERLY